MTAHAVYLWWLGYAPRPEGALQDLRAHVQRVFGYPVRLCSSPARPLGTLDVTRGQHASSRFLEFLVRESPRAAVRTLGVTDVDLFMPVLTFVYGEALLNGPVAIVSTARLGAATDGAAARVFSARLAKEAAHELGHTFGLLHCDAAACVMRRSVTIPAIDAKASTLCGDCRTLWLERWLERENAHEQGTHPDSHR